MLIGNRAHNRADGQAVEIVVDKYQHAEKNRAELSTHTGLDVLGGPTSESHRSTGFVEHCNDCAQQYEEYENSDVAGIGDGVHKSRADHVYHRSLEIKVGIKYTAHNDTDKEGRINLFGNKGEADGDQRRKQSKEGGICGNLGMHRVDGLFNVVFKIGVGLEIVGVAVGVIDCTEHIAVLIGSDRVKIVICGIVTLSHRHGRRIGVCKTAFTA